MDLKVYVNPFSQPSRAILIFCKANGISFKDVAIKLDPEINPMKQIPVIEHGGFKLSKSHSILIYLASAFPRVANHWYPTDACCRATIHSMLHWHQSNLRRGSVEYLLNSGVAIAFGLPMDPYAAFQGKKLLFASLGMIDSYWLQENGPFLLGNTQPSIVDLALACEIMQLKVIDESIISSYKKVQEWIKNTKKAIAPYFDEVHSILPVAKEMLNELIAKSSKA